MRDYNKIVKCLREAAERNSNSLNTRDVCRDAADAIEDLKQYIEQYKLYLRDAINDLRSAHEKEPKWIPVMEALPECDLGAEVENIEWISYGMVCAGCFGRGGKYRDAYFRTWTDAEEGVDAKDVDYWRAVTLPEPLKEEK